MSDTLNIPEILLQVIGDLEYEHRSLLSVIQVNRQWFDCGVPLLWRCSSLQDIVRVPAHRRHLYAPFIHTLSVSEEGNKHGIVPENIPQLNVSSLSLVNYNHELYGIQHLCQFMQARLQRLKIHNNLLDFPLMNHLAGMCPGLRDISLESCVVKGPLSLDKFLERITSLQQISILDPDRQFDPNKLFMSLASRKNLKGFDFHKTITKVPLSGSSTSVENPFPVLERVNISVCSKVITPLVDMIHSLRGNLWLAVHGSGESVLPQIGCLSGLRSLTLRLPPGTYLPKDDILALRGLVALRELTTDSSFYDPIVLHAPDFTDADFECLISCLPRLRSFTMGINWNLSAVSLDAIGRYCPQIIRISTPLMLELSRFQELFDADSAPKFPFLFHLEIEGFRWHRLLANDSGSSELIRNTVMLLNHHMPSLVVFHTSDEDDEDEDDYYNNNDYNGSAPILRAWEPLIPFSEYSLQHHRNLNDRSSP